MNWQDEVRALRQVPVYNDNETPYVRINDIPEHMRGWFVHWLQQQGQPRLEDTDGEQFAYPSDYDSWVMTMEARLRLAEVNAAAEPDREE